MPSSPPRLSLVTGASSGLGETLCGELSSRGIPLFITGRDEKRLLAAAAKHKAGAMLLDLSKSRKPLLDWIRKNKPDLIINNAGFALYGPVLGFDTSSQMDILAVNGNAAIEITIEAARALAAEGLGGTILNVSSSSGELPIPFMAGYAAAKSLLTSFSKSFDREMRSSNIRILTAIPGPIATPFAERASEGRFRNPPSFLAMRPEYAARMIWKQIQARKGVQVIDFRTRAALCLAHLFPRRLTEYFLHKNLMKRYTFSP